MEFEKAVFFLLLLILIRMDYHHEKKEGWKRFDVILGIILSIIAIINMIVWLKTW